MATLYSFNKGKLLLYYENIVQHKIYRFFSLGNKKDDTMCQSNYEKYTAV